MPPKPSKKDVYHGYVDGDFVLCKLKGYPAWPGKVFKRWQGKRVGNPGLWWCVVFFPKGDHYWARAGEMQQLTPIMIQKFLASGKKGKDREMYEGYQIAQDSRAWEVEHLSGPARAYDGPDDPDDGGGHGAVKVPPKAKSHGSKRARSESSSGPPPSASGSGSGSGKRRSVYVDDSEGAGEGQDSEDEEEREARRARKTKKKRLAGSTTKTKTVRTAADRPRHSDTASAQSAQSSSVRHVVQRVPPPPTQKKDRHLEPLAKASQYAADGVTEPMDEEAAMQWVRSMRVHLQRNLVDPKPIDVKEMFHASQRLRQLENWDITKAQIIQTKIHKVLLRIANPANVTIPDGDRHDIARRAGKLLDRWQSLLVELFSLPAMQPGVAGSQVQEQLQEGPEQFEQPVYDGGMDVQQDDWEDAPEKLEREELIGLLDREFTPERVILPFTGDSKGDSIIVTLGENGEEEATRFNSADLAGCRVFREHLANPDVPREYEDEENPGQLLKTLVVHDQSQADLHLFLHLLVGSDASRDITDFRSLQTALAIERALDAPSVRETVILRLLDRVHAGERVAETFALGAAYRSNRLVQASLGQFDGNRRAEAGTSNRQPRRIRLHTIDPDLYAMIPHALLQEFYIVEDLVVSQGYTWSVMASQFQFLA